MLGFRRTHCFVSCRYLSLLAFVSIDVAVVVVIFIEFLSFCVVDLGVVVGVVVCHIMRCRRCSSVSRDSVASVVSVPKV